MKHLAVQDTKSDSNANGMRKFIFTACAALALGFSALMGAWAQAHFYNDPGLSPEHEKALLAQASRDAAYIRESVSLLTEKVGTLQARIVAVSGLSHRVAEAAGVRYTEPELQANLSVMDYIEPDGTRDSTAELLGRQLDTLHEQLVAQEDSLALLDLMLTRRSGIDSSLPSYTPVDYPYLSSSFGWRRNPVTGRHSMHEGLDFAAPSGSPIYAATGGVVTQARFRSGYGNLVEIMHGNGLSTRYAHASAIKVKEGDLVEKGQVIALVGSTGRSTGAHLHFEVRMAGHPLDPTLFLPPQSPSGPIIADAGGHAVTSDAQVR